MFARLRQNSVVVPSRATEILGQAAREKRPSVIIGINERVEAGAGNGTLYNSLLVFGETGTLLNHHRKLVPTYTERLIWGQGEGDGLESVKTKVGQIGGLACREHWMPLARQSMHVAGEDIHVAVFPEVHEMHKIAARQYAFECRCFVLAIGSTMTVQDLPAELKTPEQIKSNQDALFLRGVSCIVDPVFDREKLSRRKSI